MLLSDEPTLALTLRWEVALLDATHDGRHIQRVPAELRAPLVGRVGSLDPRPGGHRGLAVRMSRPQPSFRSVKHRGHGQQSQGLKQAGAHTL